MELKSYTDFKRKLAVMTGPKMVMAATTKTTTRIAATATSRNGGGSADIGSSGRNKRIKLGSHGLSLSASSSPLPSLSPSPVPPTLAATNSNNYNNKRGNSIGGVKNSKSSTIGNIPFAASNWWKNGSISAAVLSKSESLSKVKGDDDAGRDDKDDTAATATLTATASRTVSSPSSSSISLKTKSPSSSLSKTKTVDVHVDTTMISLPTTQNLDTQSLPQPATAEDSVDNAEAEAETPSWLQLLRDVAASGKMNHHQQLQQDHQQRLNVSHNQDDPLIAGLPFPLFRNNNNSNNNGTGSLFTDQQQQQQNQTSMIASLAQQAQTQQQHMQTFDTSAFSNVLSQQQQQQNGMMINQLSFPHVRMPPSYYTQHTPQQHTHLQNQQRLQLELQRQRQMHQQQQQFQYQQYQHPYQAAYNQHQHHQTNISSAAFQSLAGSGEQQRQQMKQSSPVRAETNVIDALRTSTSLGRGGDIVNTDIADVPSSRDVERELEESYQHDASFDEGEENDVGLRRINDNNNNNNNRNIAQHNAINSKNNNNNTIINVDDEEDLDFSDIDGTVPDIATSLEVGPVNGDDMMIDDAINARNHQMKYASGSKKRSLAKVHPTNDLKEVKFRAYQAENWTEKFEELLQFRDVNGHCLVPNCHPENPALAQWTKRQRYQYKLKMDGKRSTITDERVRALDEAGFVWDSHKAVWAERLEELKEFKKEFGHCNVPSRYQTNHQLAIWVKRQRRQWKNKMDRQPNCMTDERQRKLEALGFVWDMKKKQSTKNTMKEDRSSSIAATTSSKIKNI